MGMILTRRYNVDRFGYLIPHRYGNLPMLGAVATFRPGEGRFGRGAVAVEEGTTNLVPSNRLKFEGWIAYSGAQVTLTQNVEFPEIGRNDATRIRTTGGTGNLKYYISIERSIADQAYIGSVYIKNIGPKPVRFRTQLGPSVTVNPGEWTRAIISGIGNGTTDFQLHFEALNVDDDLDFIAWGPQGERKPFPTSFVDRMRAAGMLVYPPNIFNPTEFTFAAWWKPVIDIPSRFSRIFQLDDGTASSPGKWLALRRTEGSKAIGLAGPNASGTSNVLYVEVTDNYDPNAWQFVACRRSGRDVYVRLNDTVAEATLGFDPAPFNIVRLNIGSTGDAQMVLNGLIDELLIFPYAASDEEIQSWYEADSPLPPHPDALLQWDWQAVRPATMVAL